MKDRLPNIRILRKEVYVSPTFARRGYTTTQDILQYKNGNAWEDIPVNNEYTFVEKGKEKVLGNY
jgi:hypothetical protein